MDKPLSAISRAIFAQHRRYMAELNENAAMAREAQNRRAKDAATQAREHDAARVTIRRSNESLDRWARNRRSLDEALDK